MRVVRVFTGNDNQSHFEDVDIDLLHQSPRGRLSRLIKGRGVIFREVDGSYDLDFHRAPRRQFVVNLSGSVDITVGDGSARRLGPGEILWAEDTTGQGHKSQAVDGQPRRCLFLPIDDEEVVLQI
jgi:hypothetical protein